MKLGNILKKENKLQIPPISDNIINTALDLTYTLPLFKKTIDLPIFFLSILPFNDFIANFDDKAE